MTKPISFLTTTSAVGGDVNVLLRDIETRLHVKPYDFEVVTVTITASNAARRRTKTTTIAKLVTPPITVSASVITTSTTTTTASTSTAEEQQKQQQSISIIPTVVVPSDVLKLWIEVGNRIDERKEGKLYI